MGIAALILGIISLLGSFIPVLNYGIILPALVGLGLGIAEVVIKSKAKQPKGMGIAGCILSGVAIFIVIVWTFFLVILGIVAEEYDNDYNHNYKYKKYNYSTSIDEDASDVVDIYEDIEDILDSKIFNKL